MITAKDELAHNVDLLGPEEILRRIEAHDALVAACQSLVCACDHSPPMQLLGQVSLACEQARAALAGEPIPPKPDVNEGLVEACRDLWGLVESNASDTYDCTSVELADFLASRRGAEIRAALAPAGETTTIIHAIDQRPGAREEYEARVKAGPPQRPEVMWKPDAAGETEGT